MEAFVVSARKYRPQDFIQVVGQEHVTQTLVNSIRNNQLAQALLFTGPRGVGKTTCARILAKMINRKDENDQTDYSLNIFELDAASNNSVEDIRSLIDQVRYAPQNGQYKVYIIDEVHMLSQSAFNAFLKTLEEPPSHAIFIMATTEKHKILPTILSRCQIYDFRRISVPDIIVHLKKIAEKEGIQYEDKALHVIAEKADGALRDALSIFDRMVSFSNKNVSYAAVTELLNVLDYAYYFRLSELIFTGNHSDLLLLLNEIYEKGFDGQILLQGLGNHMRELWVCKDVRTLPLLKVSVEMEEMYKNQAAQVDKRTLLDILKLTHETDYQYKNSQNQRLLVELFFLRAASFSSAEMQEEKKNEQPELSKSSKPIQPEPKTTESASKALAVTVPTTPQAPSTNSQAENVIPSEQVREEPNEKAKTSQKEAVKSENLQQPESPASGRQGRRGFSIARSMDTIRQESNQKGEENTEEKLPDVQKEIAIDQIKSLVNIFTQSLKEKGNMLSYSTFSDFELSYEEGKYFIVSLHSDTQEEILNDHKVDLMGMLRNALEHPGLELKVVKHKEEPKKKIKNPKELLEEWQNDNPQVKKLVDKLDLEPDY